MRRRARKISPASCAISASRTGSRTVPARRSSSSRNKGKRMSQFKRWLTIVLQGLVLALAGAFLISNALAQEPKDGAKAESKERKDLVLKGDAQCTRCHDEGDDYPVLAIGKTKHGTIADGRTPTCTSCHGESERHMNKPADAKERPRPDRTFTRTSVTPIAERNGACM